MNFRDYLSADPNVMLGKPVIKGTRITVELIFGTFRGRNVN